MASHLFTPGALRGLEMSNRVVIAPMCQYSAHDGVVGDWHLMHLGGLAKAGAGLLIAEATGVTAEGRITYGCPGLYTDEQQDAWARIVAFAKDYGNVPMGIQLGHAGRKGSTEAPWNGGVPVPADDPHGWKTVAPTRTPYADGWPESEALDEAGLERIVQAFADSAKRADAAGFELVELHGAHGYLLHQFLSPVVNTRDDAYGGSLENRMRFPLAVFDAVRAVWPDDKPLGVRISATDWIDGGWDVDQSIAFARALEQRGCDFIHVSSGGAAPAQKISAGPGYQVALASAIKRAVGDMAVIAVGMIKDAVQAETILASGQADYIAIARGALFDPHWVWHAAEALGEQAAYPPQYARAHPSLQGLPVPGNPPKPKA